MKLHGSMSINGVQYSKGDEISWLKVYPFFLFHMGMFGASGFALAYGPNEPMTAFTFAHGGIAILIYLIFYLAIFGVDQVKWLFINAGLGFFGIYSEIDHILSFFDRSILNYPWYTHVVPFTYYILYTFLLRQMILDITHSRENEKRRVLVDRLYIGTSMSVYSFLFLKDIL